MIGSRAQFSPVKLRSTEFPWTAETIYRSFDFTEPWEKVRFEDVWNKARHDHDIRVLATLQDGKVKPLFPRISLGSISV